MLRARIVLLLTTALTLAPAAALAETAATGASGPEIVVNGTRASVVRSAQIKRDANQIIDTVSASEIGQLPDFNAGDALRRVTGVNTLLY